VTLRRYRVLFFTIAAVCSIGAPDVGASVVTDSLDPDFNYELKFGSMPAPKPEVIHSRVERETERRLFWIFPLPPTNREWEFELLAAPSWVEVLRKDFLPENWNALERRSGLPGWFLPSPEAFGVWYLPGTSGIHSAHIFIELEPADPDRVRVFIRRH
jgi:hypothetical protein